MAEGLHVVLHLEEASAAAAVVDDLVHPGAMHWNQAR
jgi:hypothetical protein